MGLSGACMTRIGRFVTIAALMAAATGCSITETVQDATRIDYKSATKGPPLDIPPDLVTPRGDARFTVPDRSGTTYSQFTRERTTDRPAPGTTPGVLTQPPGARIERQGAQRWLVVDQPPEKVWPVVRDFWNQSGFALRIESPETGILETDWAERRPNVPDSWVRTQLSRVLGSLYSTAERDKYRTRLESDGMRTEVFVSHRGLVEELAGPQKDTTVWVQRPSDPELEAEFLRRLLLRFTPEGVAAASAAAAGGSVTGSAAALPDRARLIEADGRPFVALQDGFDRAWRQVGLVLDRTGFTVEDRDRSKGTFFVRYVDPEQEVRPAGMLDRVFGTGSRKDLSGKRYRIVVEGLPGEQGSRVGVLDEAGSIPSAEADRRVATQIASLLRDHLR